MPVTDYIPYNKGVIGRTSWLVTDKGCHRQLKGYSEYEKLCANPPKYLQKSKWIGIQVVVVTNKEVKSGLIDKRYR